MPAPLEDWQDLLEPRGPYRVERDDGTNVTYAARGKPRTRNDIGQVESAADIELVLYDEIGNATLGHRWNGRAAVREQEWYRRPGYRRHRRG
jgi:hypothetical protein